MATPDAQLISRIVYTGCLDEVIRYGITEDDFRTHESREHFRALRVFNQAKESRGGVMGPEMFGNNYQHTQRCDDLTVPTEALCHAVRQNRLKIVAKETAQKIADLAERDPLGAANYGLECLTQLQALGSSRQTDVFGSVGADLILDEYNLKLSGDYRPTARWPWDILNNVTMGLQPTDYIVFFGRPKSKKSWVLTYIISDLFLQGKKVLLYTKEMSPTDLYRRIMACAAQIPYHELRTAALEPEDRARLQELAEYMKSLRDNDLLVCLNGQDVPEGGDTVHWLSSKVKEHKPDVIVVDGLYLMSDGSGSSKTADWLRVTRISRSLRNLALTGTPIIATIQANRSAAKNQAANLDEVAYADAIGQDATIAFRTIADKGQETVSLIVGGSREFDLHGFRINGRVAQDFSFHSEMSQKDALSVVQKDAEDDPSVHATGKKQPATGGRRKKAPTGKEQAAELSALYSPQTNAGKNPEQDDLGDAALDA